VLHPVVLDAALRFLLVHAKRVADIQKISEITIKITVVVRG